jgi:uncharacterized protein DUF2784
MCTAVAADLVVLLHFTFIVFVVLGGLLAFRFPSVAYLHLPAVAWAAAIEFSGGICPLTPLENWLRRSSGSAGYSGGFIDHYLAPLIYPSGLTRDHQLALGVLVLTINAAIYGVLRVRRHKREKGLR